MPLSIEDKYDEVRQLISIGKEKGYLLYDEVNDLLRSDITSPDELDDLFNTFGTAGIEVVDSEAQVPGGQAGRRRRAGARPDAGRPRQDQRPGPHVPPRDGHRAAAHARGRGRDRQADRARQARRHQVDLADADRGAQGHRDGRAPESRRAHHPRAGDLQRRGDHRRADRRADARGAPPDRRRPEGAGRPTTRPSPNSTRRPKKDKRKYRRARWKTLRGRVGRLTDDPGDRVHRDGEAPADRGHQGVGRARAAAPARGGHPRSPAEPEDEEGEAQGGRPEGGRPAAEGDQGRGEAPGRGARGDAGAAQAHTRYHPPRRGAGRAGEEGAGRGQPPARGLDREEVHATGACSSST